MDRDVYVTNNELPSLKISFKTTASDVTIQETYLEVRAFNIIECREALDYLISRMKEIKK